MKHIAEIILAFIWILVAATLTGLLSYGLIKGGKIWQNPFFYNKELLGEEQTSSYTFDTDEITEIETNLICDNVRIETYNENKILVEIKTNLPENLRAEAYAEESTLKISYRDFHKLFGWNNCLSFVTIKLPLSFANDGSNSYEVRTVSGDISIDAVRGNSLKVKTTSGDISILNCTINDFDSASVSGQINLKSCSLNDAELKTTSGEILSECSAIELIISTVSGNVISCIANSSISKIKAESVSGEINLSLPENEGFTFEYSTTSGSVSDDFTNFRGKLNGKTTYKLGGTEIKTKSISGSIRISKK